MSVNESCGGHLSSGDHELRVASKLKPSNRRISLEIVFRTAQPGRYGVRRHDNVVEDRDDPRDLRVDLTRLAKLKRGKSQTAIPLRQGEHLLVPRHVGNDLHGAYPKTVSRLVSVEQWTEECDPLHIIRCFAPRPPIEQSPKQRSRFVNGGVEAPTVRNRVVARPCCSLSIIEHNRHQGMNAALRPVYCGFVALRTVRDHGHGFARRGRDGPEYLPTMAEICRPELWLKRIDYLDGRIPAVPAAAAVG